MFYSNAKLWGAKVCVNPSPAGSSVIIIFHTECITRTPYFDDDTKPCATHTLLAYIKILFHFTIYRFLLLLLLLDFCVARELECIFILFRFYVQHCVQLPSYLTQQSPSFNTLCQSYRTCKRIYFSTKNGRSFVGFFLPYLPTSTVFLCVI